MRSSKTPKKGIVVMYGRNKKKDNNPTYVLEPVRSQAIQLMTILVIHTASMEGVIPNK